MRDDDDRKLDHKTLEVMRVRAVGQIEKGARVEDVAAALGLNRSSVFKWVAAYHAGGKKALRAKPVPGRPPKLSAEQTQAVYQIVAGSNPDQHQLDFGLWTRDLVRQIISTRFGVELSLPSVGRLLHKLGMSPSGPCTGPGSPIRRPWPNGASRSIRVSPPTRSPRGLSSTSPMRRRSARTTTPAPPGPRSAGLLW